MTRASWLGGWWLRAGVAGGLLYLIIRTIPLADVARSLRSARLPEVAAAIALLGAARALSGYRMKRLTDEQGMGLSTLQIMEIGMASSFYGFVLPGSLSGGLIRWYRLGRQGKKPAGAVAAIAFDRWTDTMVLAAVGLACWALSPIAHTRALIGLILLAAIAALLGLYGMTFQQHGARVLEPFRRLLRSLAPGLMREKINRVRKALAQYHALPPTALGALLGLSVAVQLAGAASLLLLARSLNVSLPFVDVCWIRSCMLLLAMLPITVAGLGIREGSLLVFLAPYGVSGAEAIALSVLKLAAGLVLIVVGGLLELRRLLQPQRAQAS
ncbi:MAG: flippase-like domain-containing protein [Candidatus Omnitrophica bacterium]|nr:flippase-like domain-containing protein [Candidatus Omnitrophota bacterium]